MLDSLPSSRSLLLFGLIALACASGCATTPEPPPPVDPGPYPPRWWEPVPTEGAPEWEILPQAARPPQVILSKRHELGVLSNFADTPFTIAASATPAWRASGSA